MKLRVRLQGVSVTGYRVKEDRENKTKKQKTKEKHTNDTKNQLDRRVIKHVMLARPGDVVLGYV
jgi:hypothetical protein